MKVHIGTIMFMCTSFKELHTKGTCMKCSSIQEDERKVPSGIRAFFLDFFVILPQSIYTTYADNIEYVSRNLERHLIDSYIL